MDPFTTAALIQGGVAAVQGIGGALQLRKSQRDLRNLERPMMDIPDAALEALGVSRSMAQSTQMPGQVNAEQALNQQLAGSVGNIQETAGSSAEALGALTNVYAERMNAQNTLAGQAAQSYLARQQNLQNQLGRMAEWEDLKFQRNELAPYEAAAATASAMGGAGLQNIFQGISGIGSAVSGNMLNKELMNRLNPPSAPQASMSQGAMGTGMMGAANTSNQVELTPEQLAAIKAAIGAF